ncbi:MAG: BACON domain-containing protein [Alistipes sp.]|nr:BACON domain-containing protein [Alistipes sp.]
MANKLFKSFFAVALVLGSALGFVACEDKGDDVVADPKVEVSATSLNFTMEEGSQSVELTANSDWKVEVDDADWVTVTPTAGKGDATLTVAVAMNESGAVRTSIVKVIALHKEYGNWDTKKITVSQSASETPTVEEELLYGDDFDAEEATKTYGSGSSWPYLDQFPQFANPEGPAAENVTYSGKGVSIRANSTSDSQYSDYAGSGSNNIFFGSSAYFQVNNITLAEGQQNLKLTFGSEKYTQDGDSTFKNEEFHIYLSKDGNGWAEIKEYTFAGTEGGRWNVATAEFSLTSVPETLYLKFAADVASVYRLDDVKLFSGNGGQTIDLDNIEAPEPVEVKKVTVAEFLAAAEDSTVYELTGEITNVTNTTYGNFYLKDSTAEVLIYGLCSPTGEQKYWAESGAKVGDTITVQTVRTSYNGTPQGKDAIFVSLVPGEGGEEPTPEPAEGPYASDAPFVCSTDDSTNAVYSLGATTIDGNSVIGFKLGKGKQTGLFKSGAVGVSGDKYLNLYAVAWKGGDAKLYFRVDGGATQTLEIAPNEGASNNAPYTALTFADTDHYSVKLSGLSATSTIEFSTDANFELTSADATISYARAIVCGVKLTDEPISGEAGGNEEPEDPIEGSVTIAEAIAAADGAAIVIENATVIGVYSRGVLVEDTTGKLLVYAGSAVSANVGDVVKVEGAMATYGGLRQVGTPTVTVTGSTSYTYPTATVMDGAAMDAYLSNPVIQYVEYTGTLAISGYFYNVSVDGAATAVGSLAYVIEGTVDPALNGQKILVKGWTIGFSGGKYVNTMITSVTAADGGTTEPEPEDPVTPEGVVKATVAEFLAAAEDDTIYELTGEITSVANTTYGNFYLKDETAEVYIYGLCSPEGEQKYWAESGVKVGDTITVQTVRTSYNGTPQGKNAIYVSHISVEVEEPVVPEGSTVATITFADAGYANAEVVDGVTIALDENVSVVFSQGGANNAPAYYESGQAIRMYQNGATLDVTANGKSIQSIELTFANNHYYVAADCGELSKEAAVRTWTGESTAVKFTSTGTDKDHRAYVAALKVTYKN